MGAETGLLVLFLIVTAYFFPTIIAAARRKTGKAQVLIVNLFLGWTFIGWVIALVMAFGSDNTTNVTVVQTVAQDKSETKEEE